jgi:hypothetical protein
MESISNAIVRQITENGYGKLYFTADFHFPGKEEAVKKTLFRLGEKEVLVRLAHGIYLYPAKHEKIGILYPSIDEIAKGIAARDKSECLPTGALAMNVLGFSTQVPMNAVYITDGTPRSIQIGQRKIVFKKAAPKYFHYKSKLMFLLTAALKEIGEKNIDNKVLERVKELLSMKREIALYKDDLALAPVWIKKILITVINQIENEYMANSPERRKAADNK